MDGTITFSPRATTTATTTATTFPSTTTITPPIELHQSESRQMPRPPVRSPSPKQTRTSPIGDNAEPEQKRDFQFDSRSAFTEHFGGPNRESIGGLGLDWSTYRGNSRVETRDDRQHQADVAQLSQQVASLTTVVQGLAHKMEMNQREHEREDEDEPEPEPKRERVGRYPNSSIGLVDNPYRGPVHIPTSMPVPMAQLRSRPKLTTVRESVALPVRTPVTIPVKSMGSRGISERANEPLRLTSKEFPRAAYGYVQQHFDRVASKVLGACESNGMSEAEISLANMVMNMFVAEIRNQAKRDSGFTDK